MPKLVLVELLQSEFTKFREHVNRVKIQYRELKKLKGDLPEGEVIVQMDFSENYMCSTPGNVQSQFWNPAYVTLHPVVVYYKEGDVLEHRSFNIMSDGCLTVPPWCPLLLTKSWGKSKRCHYQFLFHMCTIILIHHFLNTGTKLCFT